MSLLTKKTTTLPRRNYQKQIRTYTVVTVIVFIAALVYGFLQYQKLAEAKTAIEQGQEKLIEMQTFKNRIADQYTTINTSFNEDFRDIREAINGTLPKNEDYTKLTQILDAFVNDLNKRSPTIFMSNLRFSQPRLDNDKGYAVLPFSMTLSTTKDNFERILQYVESSGSLDEGSRLLSINSITINFPTKQVKSDSSSDNDLSVSLSLNAYFQLPADIL